MNRIKTLMKQRTGEIQRAEEIKLRKHLNADALFATMRKGFAGIRDRATLVRFGQDHLLDAIKKMTQKLDAIEKYCYKNNDISISDVSMSFCSMVIFMVKWAIASTPAVIIFFLIPWIFILIFGTLWGFTLR